MFRRVGLILALMMTSAAADDYRSYREAYAAVDWPNSITSAEQCQRRVDDVVRQFGFTDPEARMSRWTGDPALWVKDKVHHFDIVFSCGPGKRILNINIDSWEGQTASAGDLLDTLINSFAAPKPCFTTGSVKLADYPGNMVCLSCKRCGRGQHVLVLKTFDDHE